MALSPNQCDRKVVAIEILKASSQLDVNTIGVLQPSLIQGIIQAEASRMSWGEKYFYDGGGVGPGQMYKPAYTDVHNNFSTELNQFVSHLNSNCGYQLKLADKEDFKDDLKHAVLADFYIAAYLALRIKASQRPGRTAQDALKYGIAIYYGARQTVVDAQKAAAPADFANKKPIPWSTLETHAKTANDVKLKDVIKYVTTVVNASYSPNQSSKPKPGKMPFGGIMREDGIIIKSPGEM